MDIETLKKSGFIAYEYIRGSQLYGTSLPGGKSDTDIGGVFVLPNREVLGLPEYYIPQVSDERNDTTYYEFGRWVELLTKSNPTALESLFVPDDKVIGKIHPAVAEIIGNRDMFLSKDVFKSLIGYSVGQIKKARGLNKKIVNPVHERKSVLDFCYVAKGDGSIPMGRFLSEHGLEQEYCGLSSVPNMRGIYAVHYDFGKHFEDRGITLSGELCGWMDRFSEDPLSMENDELSNIMMFMSSLYGPFITSFGLISAMEDHMVPIGYRGIMNTDGSSNKVRLSSIPKGEAVVCYMSYNEEGYTCHCREYREYKEWERKRNPVRYESNLDKNYDSKNMYNVVRLIDMGYELVTGKGFNPVRTDDLQFLLDIRNHKVEYEAIISYAEKKKEEIDALIPECGLPDHIDIGKVNELLKEIRANFGM